MVEKVYIIWCKTNKNTRKFDVGVFTDKKIAQEVADTYIQNMYSVAIETYKLSKPLSEE